MTNEREQELWRIYNKALTKHPDLAAGLFEALREYRTRDWAAREHYAQLQRVREVFAIRPTEELTLAAAMYDSQTLPITGWRPHPFIADEDHVAVTHAALPTRPKCYICGDDKLRTWHTGDESRSPVQFSAFFANKEPE